MEKKLQVFAVIRVDSETASLEDAVTIKEILSDADEAEIEVERLNKLPNTRAMYPPRGFTSTVATIRNIPYCKRSGPLSATLGSRCYIFQRQLFTGVSLAITARLDSHRYLYLHKSLCS